MFLCVQSSAIQAAGVAMVLSTMSTVSIEDVANNAAGSLLFFQLYIFRDRKVTRGLIERAEKAGFSAVVLTVDYPVKATRRSCRRSQFELPHHLK
jgi:(S)-2-hydroxy-acid oxidase